MKKIKLLAVLMLCPIMLFGQLEKLSDGRIFLLSENEMTNTIRAHFSVLTDYGRGISVERRGHRADAPNSLSLFGVRAVSTAFQNLASSNQTVAGVYGRANSASTIGNVIGVQGSVSGSSSNRAGVVGLLSSTGQTMLGVAVLGNVGSVTSITSVIPQNSVYAGFFRGNVHGTGLMSATSFAISSDYRYKQNIVSLNSLNITSSLNDRSRTLNNSVLMLNPVSYNLRQRYIETVDSLDNKIMVGFHDENAQFFQNHHYGLIAQEVQQIFPNLVFENGEGYLSINYIGLIPLLIQTLQEQNATIQTQNIALQEQNTRIERLENANNPIIDRPFGARAATQEYDVFTLQSQEIQDNLRTATLYQNAPNPFSQSTEIRYYLPQNVTTAFLIIYDMNGRQIKQLRISERGEGSLVISGSELAAGMYLYALIADGKKVDVKRMILTE